MGENNFVFLFFVCSISFSIVIYVHLSQNLVITGLHVIVTARIVIVRYSFDKIRRAHVHHKTNKKRKNMNRIKSSDELQRQIIFYAADEDFEIVIS